MKVKLALAALAFSGLSAVASAQSVEVATIDVSYADLNLSSRAGAEAMLNRIQAAASRVCGGKPETRQMTDMARYRSCVSTAVRTAVSELNAAMVTQLYGNPAALRETSITQR
jgi:UrcA family protein